MLRALVEDATALLNLTDATVLARVSAALDAGWRTEAEALLGETQWRAQLVAAAALVLGGGDATAAAALWCAIDSASWVAPQLVAAGFLVDDNFVARAEERLLAGERRPPKTIGALVRAYHRLPAPRLAVVSQLHRHDRTMATEEARIGVRGVDAWIDGLGAHVR